MRHVGHLVIVSANSCVRWKLPSPVTLVMHRCLLHRHVPRRPCQADLTPPRQGDEATDRHQLHVCLFCSWHVQVQSVPYPVRLPFMTSNLPCSMHVTLQVQRRQWTNSLSNHRAKKQCRAPGEMPIDHTLSHRRGARPTQRAFGPNPRVRGRAVQCRGGAKTP